MTKLQRKRREMSRPAKPARPAKPRKKSKMVRIGDWSFSKEIAEDLLKEGV